MNIDENKIVQLSAKIQLDTESIESMSRTGISTEDHMRHIHQQIVEKFASQLLPYLDIKQYEKNHGLHVVVEAKLICFDPSVEKDVENERLSKKATAHRPGSWYNGGVDKAQFNISRDSFLSNTVAYHTLNGSNAHQLFMEEINNPPSYFELGLDDEATRKLLDSLPTLKPNL